MGTLSISRDHPQPLQATTELGKRGVAACKPSSSLVPQPPSWDGLPQAPRGRQMRLHRPRALMPAAGRSVELWGGVWACQSHNSVPCDVTVCKM